MKKVLALMLAVMLTMSLVTIPASAEDTSETIKTTLDFEKLDSKNYLYEGSSLSLSGLSIAVSTQNISSSLDSRFGVVDTKTNKVTLANVIGKSSAKTVHAFYEESADYEFILGKSLSSNLTYNGTNDTTTGSKIGRLMEGAYLKAVADPTGSNNKVIEFNFGKAGDNQPGTQYKGVLCRLTYGTDTAMYDTATQTAEGTGILAYEWDFYVPENSAKWMTTKSPYINIGGIMGAAPSLMYDRTYYENGELIHSLRDKAGKYHNDIKLTTDTWHTMKQVVIIDKDVVVEGTEIYPLVAVFLDGDLKFIGRPYNPLKSNGTKGTTGLLRFALAPTGTSTVAGLNKDVDFNIYYDNVKQYWIKNELTISGIENSYEGFNPAKDFVEVKYSNTADFDALEDAISVKLNGEVAENVSVNVEGKDENTAILTFSGLNTTVATNYDVEIAGFKDVYGNTNNEVKTFSITTYQAGKLNMAKSDSVIDYEVGTHKAFAIISEAKTDISDVKFYVEDAEGEEVAELTPSVNDEGTVFTFDLYSANLPQTTASYTFVTEGAFKEADGERINSDVIEIQINVVNYGFEGIYLINDNFDGEGIVKDTNWITNSSARPSGWSWKAMCKNYNSPSGAYTDKFGDHTSSGHSGISIKAEDNILSDVYVAVTEDPKDATNNVIKYMAGKNGDGLHTIRIRRELSNTTVDPAKNVVMSSKVLLTESLKNYMADFKYNDLPVMATRSNYEDNFLVAQFKEGSDGNLVLTANDGFTTTLKTDEWFELKYVTMPTTKVVETKDDADNVTEVTYDVWTYMVYINDILVDVNSKTVFNGNKGTVTADGVKYTGAFCTTANTGYGLYGVQFGLYPENNGENQLTFYVDDVKLYQPDNFVPSVTANGTEVVISADKTFAKNVLDTIKITNKSGKAVDAIALKEISADKKTITLELVEDAVEISTDYVIAGVYDSLGQMAKNELTFTTPKSFGVYIDSATKADTSESGKVKTTVKIGNSKAEELPVLFVVAVYGEDYEMLGVETVKIDKMGAEGYNGTVAVDIGSYSKSDIKSIQMFLWDSIDSMIPYQLDEALEF